MNQTTQTILTISQLLSIIVLGGTVLFAIAKIIITYIQKRKTQMLHTQDQTDLQVTLSKDFTDKEYRETIKINNAMHFGSIEFPAEAKHIDKLMNALTSIKKDMIQRQSITKNN